MTENEKQLVMKYVRDFITEDEFLRRYPHRVRSDGQHVHDLLKDAATLKDPDEVEYALMLGFSFGFGRKVIPLLNSLLSQDWHYKHEDIARLLQQFRDPSSVDVLYEVVAKDLAQPGDDSYPLAVKCIWALGEINTIESREYLKRLTSSTKTVIRENAKRQLARFDN